MFYNVLLSPVPNEYYQLSTLHGASVLMHVQLHACALEKRSSHFPIQRFNRLRGHGEESKPCTINSHGQRQKSRQLFTWDRYLSCPISTPKLIYSLYQNVNEFFNTPRFLQRANCVIRLSLLELPGMGDTYYSLLGGKKGWLLIRPLYGWSEAAGGGQRWLQSQEASTIGHSCINDPSNIT